MAWEGGIRAGTSLPALAPLGRTRTCYCCRVACGLRSLGPCGARHWQCECEACAALGCRIERDGAAMRLHQRAHDRQPQAAAAGRCGARGVEAVEALEDPLAFGA